VSRVVRALVASRAVEGMAKTVRGSTASFIVAGLSRVRHSSLAKIHMCIKQDNGHSQPPLRAELASTTVRLATGRLGRGAAVE